jgi:hypothetical protein
MQWQQAYAIAAATMLSHTRRTVFRDFRSADSPE